MTDGLLKEAAQTLRTLNQEVKTLKKEKEDLFEIEKISKEILAKLIERDELKLEDILEKQAELLNTSMGELVILQKALDITKTQVKLGSLSNSFGNVGTQNATERFIDFLTKDTEYEE